MLLPLLTSLVALAPIFVCARPSAASTATPCSSGTDLGVVAHEDDDLIFLAADAAASLRSGRCLHTAYLTAGDSGDTSDYWRAREEGVRAAYAHMAGVDDVWVDSSISLNGRAVVTSRLAGDGRVALVFFRLPDGLGSGDGSATYHNESIGKLWMGTLSMIKAVDGSASYTKSELAEALRQLIVGEQPSRVRTLGSVDTRGVDHPDHYYTALFTGAAYDGTDRRADLINYRGYDVQPEGRTVSGTAASDAFATLLAYANYDSKLCYGGNWCLPGSSYEAWTYRQYRIKQTGPFPGAVVALADCLDVPGNSTTDGTRVDLTDCTNGPQQKWIYTSTGLLRDGARKCLAASGSADGSGVVIKSCGTATSQKWAYTAAGELRVFSTKCLTVSGADAAAATRSIGREGPVPRRTVSSMVANGTLLEVAGCTGGANQHFQIASSYWTPGTNGSHSVGGANRETWARFDWEGGLLGYLRSDELATATGSGFVNHFEGGDVYRSSSTGSHEVHGPIRSAFDGKGGVGSCLGFPKTDVYRVTGGERSDFTGGSIIAINGAATVSCTNSK